MTLVQPETRTPWAADQAKSAATDADIFIPERHVSERAIALFVFVLTCSYLLLFRHFNAMDPDEGIVLQGAQRILQGQVLYRDFFSFFTPGSYYLLALFFEVFGDSMEVARTTLVIVGGVCSVVAYLLARRVCARWSALLAAGIVTLTGLPLRFLVLHNWDGTLWACLALYCAVRMLDSPRGAWAFGAGSFIALTILFEQSKGVGLVLGLGIGLWAIAFAGPKYLVIKRNLAIWIAGGLVWPFAVTLIFFAAQQSTTAMLADWFWPLWHYSGANRVPYGYQNWSDNARVSLFGSGTWFVRFVTVLTISPLLWIPVLPLVALGLGIFWMVQVRRGGAAPGKCAYYVLIGWALTGLLLSVIATRADIVHFIYLQPLFCLVLAWFLEGNDIPGRFYAAVRPFFITYILFALLALSAAALLRSVNAPVRAETRRGAINLPARDTVLDYVQAQIPAGETILVYPYLPLYYYLTDTYSPARYDYLQPGMHTIEQARAMVSQIDSHRPQVVLLEPSFAEKIPTSWPATPESAIASDPVTDYILQNYRSCKVLKSSRNWRFLFMVRKEAACPSGANPR